MSDMSGKLGETRDSRIDVGSSRFESDIGQVRLNLTAKNRIEEGYREQKSNVTVEVLE